jgi:hypothetical protein
VAAVLGSAVNDSGAIVGGVTLMVLVSALAWLAMELVATSEAGAPGPAPAAPKAAEPEPPGPLAPGEPAAAAPEGAQPPVPSPARAGGERT